MALTKVSSGLISADAALVDLNIDAGTLYIDATNNRVGVSNQAPTVALEVTGDLVVSASATLGDTQVGQLTFSSLTNTTTDIPEGSKLFFTEQRVLDTTPGGSLSGTLGDVTVQYRTDGNYSGTAQQGSFYFDALNQRLKVYTGSEFIDTIPFTAGGGGGATTEANATFFKYQYTVTSETNNISGADIQEIESGSYVIGKDYEISVPGTTDFTALGAADNNIGTTFTATASGLVSAGDFVATEEYTIVSVDDGAGGATTDFTLIGAADNNIGTTFTATGVGAGTGTASQGSGTAHGILGYSTSSSTDVVVFVNGVKQRESLVDGYQATTGTTIAFTYNLPVDSIVDVQVYELLKNDAYYTKSQTYTQAEVNTQISTALSTYDDQTASDARYVNIDGDTMTGNLDVTGTTNPTLTITDTTNTTTLSLSAGNLSTTIGTTTNHPLTFDTNASEAMRIDASGNVGIGAGSTNTKLVLSANNGGGAENNTLRFEDTDTATGTNQVTGKIEFYSSDTTNTGVHSFISGETKNTTAIGELVFATGVAGSAEPRMRITSSGNVGIGIDIPSDLMTIQSPASGGGNGITIKRNDNGTDQRVGAISFGNTVDSDLAQITVQTSAGNNGDGNLLFHTQPNGGSSTERMRIDSSGDIRLTGTAPNAEDSISTVNFYNSSSSLNLASITGKRTAGGTNYGSLIFNTTSAGSIAERMRIDSSGTLITKGAAIFNEDGADADFRVESVNRSNAFVVDASADAITTDAIFIHDSDGGNQRFYITRTGASDQSGSMYTDDAQFVFDSVQDETTLSFGGFLFRSTNATNSNVQLLNLAQTESRFNDDGADIDFRVESVNDSSMLFVDASEDSVNIGAHKFASTPTSTDNDFVHFNTGAIVVNDSSSATVNLFQRSASGSGVSCAGTVFVACEGSGQNVSWGYIIDFFYSNNVFTSTARETGSSQGTTTCSVQENGTAISVSVAYTTGLGGNIKFNAGGHAVVCNY